MPALPPVANVLRADVLWTYGSDVSVSTRQYFRYSGGPPNSTDATTLGAAIFNALQTMSSEWGSAVTMSGVRVTDLSSAGGGQGEHAGAQIGTGSGLPLNAGTAVLVNYVIARRYRGGKPRSYWPFFTIADLATPQTWLGASLTRLDNGLSGFYAAVIGTVAGTTTITNHVNVSYYATSKVVISPTTGRARNVPQLRAGGPVVDVVNSYAASARPASQRRRN
jgi:hypothetical protein